MSVSLLDHTAVRSQPAAHRGASGTAHGAHADSSGALRFFWTVLAVAAVVSVVANGYHAWMRSTVLPPVVAALVATIAPVALLAATHGVALLLRSASASPVVRWSAVAITFCIAAGGFRVSFDAQTDLATQAGQAGNAWLVPLLVDGFILQATIAVVALSRPQPRPEPPTPGHPPAAPALAPAAPAPGTRPQLPAPQPEPELDPGQLGEDPDRWAAIADRVCAGDPAGRRDPSQVARILRLRHVDGLSHSRIAGRVGGISASTVTRVLAAARDHISEPL